MSKHWKVFEDDQQIKKFLEMVEKFSTHHIDQDNENDNDQLKKNLIQILNCKI
jgi:hypothetical protein